MLDECVSPRAARRLNEVGVDAYHVRDRGMAGAPDHEVWRQAVNDGRCLVTINLRDFVALAKRGEIHGGLITLPPQTTADEQFDLIVKALSHVAADAPGAGFLNKWLDIDVQGRITVQDLPE